MSKKTLDETQELKVLISQLKGFCETIQDILHDKDTSEIGRYSCFCDMAHIYNDFVERAKGLFYVQTMFYTFDLDKMPSWGDSAWPIQKKILEQVMCKNALFKFGS